jgi:hypothetical protein
VAAADRQAARRCRTRRLRHTLIVEAAEELAWALGEEIFELTRSGMRRHMLIEAWRKKNATAATVA